MKISFQLCLLALALCGCESANNIQGAFRVKSPVTFQNGDSKVELLPGEYKAAIELKGDATIFSTKEPIASSLKLPAFAKDFEGDFAVSGEQLQQTFDVQGKVYRQVRPLDRIVKEKCVHHTERQFRCYIDSQGEQFCQWETFYVHGRQKVRETGTMLTKNVEFDLIRSTTLATFSGSYALKTEVQNREYIGVCEL